MSMTVSKLLSADTSQFSKHADGYRGWADAAMKASGHLDSKVGQHIAEPFWQSKAAIEARTTIANTRAHLSHASARLKKIETSLVNAEKEFEQAQRAARSVISAIGGDGSKSGSGSRNGSGGYFSWSEDGTVTYHEGANETGNQANAHHGDAANYTRQLQGALRRAGNADTDIANVLDGLAPPTGDDSGDDPPPYQPTSYHEGPGSSAGSYGGSTAGGDTSVHSGGDAKEAQEYARKQLRKYGWTEDQMEPLIKLWNQESGWNDNAVNASSGAYGIPQALGHGHPFNLGDYKKQIDWGLQYIHDRYGTPAKAWAHEVANNWY